MRKSRVPADTQILPPGLAVPAHARTMILGTRLPRIRELARDPRTLQGLGWFGNQLTSSLPEFGVKTGKWLPPLIAHLAPAGFMARSCDRRRRPRESWCQLLLERGGSLLKPKKIRVIGGSELGLGLGNIRRPSIDACARRVAWSGSCVPPLPDLGVSVPE